MSRKLTSANYTVWITRRMNGFAAALGGDSNNAAYQSLPPSMQFASSSYDALHAKFELRRLVFFQVYNTAKSRSSTDWVRGCQTSLVFLSGTEMTQFLTILNYIVIQNPILLTWNELAKETPYLIDAYNKWLQLRDLAPFAKLAYPNRDTEEFNRSKLARFAEVATAIANQSGQTSMSNYKGVGNSMQLSDLVKHAKIIVEYWNVAQTHLTNAIDRNLLIDADNEELRRKIHVGAEMVRTLTNDPTQNIPIQGASILE